MGIENNQNVALKAYPCERGAREHQILQHLQTLLIALKNVSQPGRNIVALWFLDDSNDSAYGRRRLVANAAKGVACQLALELDYLWNCGMSMEITSIIY